MGSRSTTVAVACLGAVLCGRVRPAAGQDPGEYVIPAPSFGGAPAATPYTEAPALVNRDEVRRGTTKLRLHVDISGNATAAEIASSSGSPPLDSLALSLKDMLVFVPAIRDGLYAEGTAELPIRFPPKEER